MGLRSRFDRWRNRITIRRQLSLLVGLLVFILITALIFYAYASQARSNLMQQQESLERLLEMEGKEIDSYLDELSLYAILLRNDTDFMSVVRKYGAMEYDEVTSLEGILRTYFYARQDIRCVDVWLVRRDAAYTIESEKRRMTPLEKAAAADFTGDETFRQSPAYLSLRTTEDGLLEVTRTIIDAPRKDELAYVRILAERTKVTELEKRHFLSDERFFLFDHTGTSLGTDAGAQIVLAAVSQGNGSVILDGTDCILASNTVGDRDFTIAVTKPFAVLNASLISSRNRALVLGLLSVFLTIAFALWIIRTLTAPLSALENRLNEIGAGDFSVKPEIQGSSEMLSLSREINKMASDISSLIDRNYLATIGERTAQLAALEAQTNPHFLYNTLQAVGAEALATGNKTVYQMITRLASLLRYTIQGGNLTPLRQEIEYTEKYLSLQQARYGERLQYSISGDETLLEEEVPKLGILSLAENSIVHGMKDTTDTVTIQIGYCRNHDGIELNVKDDGCGISPNELEIIRSKLSDPSVVLTENIGLINLSSRIRLLYHGTASIRVESSQQQPRGTTVTIFIPSGGIIHETRVDY